ncbi:MAG: type II secretion system F family protein [Candidatus Eisenbacteria bacterium]|nr:type II secretion system F family protein [Candidatus Eisenbacteria bacterium]
MTTYVWKGRTADGSLQGGEITAPGRHQAMARLRRRRVAPTELREKKASAKGRGAKRPKGVKGRDLSVFTRQFSTMVNAGLPLVQCLDILSRQTENEAFRGVIGDVMRRVQAGATLAEAMGRRPEAFNSLYVSMVDAGESGGILDDILMRLAQYIERAEALKRKVKGAMTYPLIVFSVAVLATVFMLLFIIPVFAGIFEDFGGELPGLTKLVVAMSEGLKRGWWLLAGMIVASVMGFKRYYRTSDGKRRVDGLLLRAPVFGDLVRKSSIARFARTLGTLIASGVPILSGLDITARTAGNKVIEEAIMATKGSIREGETIAAPLREARVFPPMVVQMIAVGEETGALDKMLEKIASFYDDEVAAAVETLTSIIEPVMMVGMGLLVGGMVVSMYLPMFELINVVSNSA